MVTLNAVYEQAGRLPSPYRERVVGLLHMDLCARIDALAGTAPYAFEDYLRRVLRTPTRTATPEPHRVIGEIDARTWRELAAYSAMTAPVADVAPDALLCGVWVQMTERVAAGVQALNTSPRPGLRVVAVEDGEKVIHVGEFVLGTLVGFRHGGEEYVLGLEVKDE